MKVVAIRKQATAAPAKVVDANQKAIDALPLNSGTWSVKGIAGLSVRCRAQTKSFFVQRQVNRQTVREILGPLALKQAREHAMRIWSGLKPKPAGGAVTLEAAFDLYLADKPLAAATVKNYRFNLDNYLKDWKSRSLHDIGADRAGVRALQRALRNKYGPATSNQVVRLLSSVYRWQRNVDTELPEPPTTAIRVDSIPARDWAYTPKELEAWWRSLVEVEVEGEDPTTVERGVKTLGPIKRMWWLTALFTGARKGSIEALRWQDLDLDKKTIRFTVTKGDRPYAVPMADTLAELLTQYRDRGEVPPSQWVFPSSVRDGKHIVGVKDDKQGAGPAHRLRHSFRTTLAQLGASPDQARMLMGHSMGGDVSRGYISAPLVLESLRPVVNAVAKHYMEILKIGAAGD